MTFKIPKGWREVGLHLEFDGASPLSLPWPRYRELMDAWVKAICAMEGGPEPDEIVPLQMKAGSVEPSIISRVSRLDQIRRWARGPTKTWTAAEWAGSHDIWQAVEGLGAVASLGVDGCKPIAVRRPPPDTPLRVHQFETLEGTLWAAGGKTVTTVRLELDGMHTRAFEAQPRLVYAMRQCLYHRVRVEGEAVRVGPNAELEALTIFAFEDLGRREDWERRNTASAQREAIRELKDALAPDLDGVDVEKLMRSLRQAR